MKAARIIAVTRHFLALYMFMVMLSLFTSAAGKVAAQSHGKSGGDPVISSMTWEVLTGDGSGLFTDGVCNEGCVYNNCQKNGTCPTNCPSNCPSNCYADTDC